MLRLGKFTDAIERGDERRSSLRKENATMYSDFISQNPGASVEERMEFANGLIQETGVGTRGLPTKSTMSSKVKTYRDEQARIATDRAASLERDRLAALRQMQTDRISVLENAARLNSSPEETAKALAAFGIKTDKNSTDDLQDQVNKLRFNSWQKEHQELIAAYYKNPSKAAYDRLASEGTDFASEIESRYKTVYEGTYDRLLKEYKAERRELDLKTGLSQAQYDAELLSLNEKYPSDAIKDIRGFEQVQDGVREGTVKEEDLAASLRLNQLIVVEAQRRNTTEAEYDNAVQGILLQFTPEQRKLSEDQIATSKENKAGVLGAAKTLAQKQFISNANSLLTGLTENGTSSDIFQGEVKRLKAEALTAGYELPANFGDMQKEARNTNETSTQKEKSDKFVADALYRMQALAMQSGATQESLTALTDKLRKEGTADGHTLPTDFGAKSQAIFIAADALRSTEELATFSTTANGNLDALALSADTTQALFDAALRSVKQQALDKGLELDLDFGESQQVTLDVELKKREDLINETQGDLIENAVTQSADEVAQAVRDNKGFEDILANIESAISTSSGVVGDIKLDDELTEKLKEMFDASTEQLKIDIDAYARSTLTSGSTVEGQSEVLNRTKEQFVEDFVLSLEASAQGSIKGAKERFSDIAEDTFDGIISAVRTNNNQQEVADINMAIFTMNESRQLPPAEGQLEILKSLLMTPSIVGVGDDAVGQNTAEIVSSAYIAARKFAQDSGIFLTDEMMQDIGAFLGDPNADATNETAHVAGSTFDVGYVQQAVQEAFIKQILSDEGNMPLESEAYLFALEEVQADNTAGIVALDREQLFKFKTAFEKYRREAAEDKFDIFGSSFENDVGRSDDVQSNIVVTGEETAALAATVEEKFATIASLVGEDFITATDLVASMTGYVKSQEDQLPRIIAQKSVAKKELSKLQTLLRTQVYKKSDNRAVVQQRIDELSASVTILLDAEARITKSRDELNLLAERVPIEIAAQDVRVSDAADTLEAETNDAAIIAARALAEQVSTNRTDVDNNRITMTRAEKLLSKRLTSGETTQLEELIVMDEPPEGSGIRQVRWKNGGDYYRRGATTEWLLDQYD